MLLDRPLVGVDDANITLVYARNFARGAGLVFTPGFERVEGFTSLTWMATASLAYAVGSPAEGWLRLLSVAFVALTLRNTLAAARWLLPADRADHEAPALTLLVGWLCAIPWFYAWATASLLETALFAYLVSSLARLLAEAVSGPRSPASNARRIAIVSVALLGTRPESLAIVPGALTLACALAARERGFIESLKTQAVGWIAFAVTASALFAFRASYFGQLLPNTYYAKAPVDLASGLVAGAGYLAAYFVHEPLAAVFALGAGVCAVWGMLRRARGAEESGEQRATFALACFALGGLALPLPTGGDHFSGARLYQPFAPLLVLPMLPLWSALSTRLRPALRPVGTGVSLLLVGCAAVYGWSTFASDDALAREFLLSEEGRRGGRAFAALATPDPPARIGVVVSGGFAFTYPGRTVDLMGLSWAAMAHSPGPRTGIHGHTAFDADTFWQDPPEIITPRELSGPLDGPCGTIDSFDVFVLRSLQLTRRFRSAYVQGYVTNEHGNFGAFFLESWLDRVNPRGVFRFRTHCGRAID